MKKFQILFLFFSLVFINVACMSANAQQVQKKKKKTAKHVVQAKDSVADSIKNAVQFPQNPVTPQKLAADSLKYRDSMAIVNKNKKPGTKKQAAKGKTGKQKAKTPVKKEVVETTEKKDSVPEIKDSVKVTFGRNLVNLRTFNGWIIDERGKWVSSPNRIPFENPEYNNELYKKYEIGSENIRQINIVEVKIDSTPYLAIILESYKGHYRDKMDTDFHMFVGADFFLINPADYQDLWNDSMKMKTPYQANLRAYFSGLVGYKDIKLRPKYMASEINKDIRNYKYTDTAVKIYLQLGFMPFKNKNGSYMRFNYGLAYARTGTPVPPFDFSVFKHRFYEADLELFHKFSRPKSIPVVKRTPKAPAAEKKKEENIEQGPRED